MAQPLSSPAYFSKLTKWFVVLASLSMYVTLFIPYNGEEGVYTIGAMEMAHSGHYWITTVYGHFYGRPPLLDWLIVAISKIVGWQYVLQASRFITATATILTCLSLGLFVRAMTQNKNFAWVCAAVFYGEAYLMRLGWLAYSDTLLSLFAFLGMALLWYAVETRKYRYTFLALVSVCLGFLVKALTPYFFFACAGLVLLISHRHRAFLVRPTNIVFYLLALSFPYFFAYWTDPTYLTLMWHTLIHGEHQENLWASWHTVPKYLYQAFIFQPSQLFVVLLPFSLVVLWCLIRFKQTQISQEFKRLAGQSFWVFLVGFLPCWLSWNQWPETRYYMPVLPFLSIAIAYLIWNARASLQRATVYLMVAALVVKFVFIPLSFYIRGTYFRLPYSHMAQDILKRTNGEPLQVAVGYSSQGLGLTNALDSLMAPKAVIPLKNPQASYRYIAMPSCRLPGRRPGPGEKVVKIYRGDHTSDTICLIQIANAKTE